MTSARAARTLEVLLGTWLFASAFLWTHRPLVRLDDWAIGLAILLGATVAASFPRWRWAIALLGAWILVAEYLVPGLRTVTRWHDGVIAVLVLLAAFVPDPRERGPREAEEPLRI